MRLRLFSARPRWPGRGLAITAGAAFAVLPLVVSPAHAAASAARTGPPAASTRGASTPAPLLTTNTNAGCNRAMPPGYARCLAVVRTPADHQITASQSGPPAGSLGPADIQSAYRLPSTGAGQTVAIVDAYGDSHAEKDLAAFRAHYKLPPCTTATGCLRKVDQNGGTSYPADNPDWGMETTLDLDAVSSACPRCDILLVQAVNEQIPNLAVAENEAVALGARYISNSYGAGENPSLKQFDADYNHPGVAVAASTGDTGNVILWPSSDPDVTAVGGTSLVRDSHASRGWSESAWGTAATGAEGGGSGCSAFEPRPAFQLPVKTGCAMRATADIAAVADPKTGLAIYDTLGKSGWMQVGGTSLAAPLITAMHALAGPPASGTFPVAAMYHDTHLTSDVYDVTTGSNGSCGTVLCNAGPGWDGPTGLGTPHGVGVFGSRPQGRITGIVTDSKTGKPVPGATVTASPGNYLTSTGTDGTYTLDVAAGNYTLTAAKYAFRSRTDSGIAVAAKGTATARFALAELPRATVSGTVKDGSGHGWALYARVTFGGYPGGPVYTDPLTGRYSVVLAAATYSVHVAYADGGVTQKGLAYQPLATHLTVGSAAVSRDFTLMADKAACTAPGYGPAGLQQTFTNWKGATPAGGWTISGKGWRFDNPGSRPPPSLAGGSFAIADSSAEGTISTTLTSALVSMTGQAHPVLAFDSAYFGAAGQRASADLSTDGGKTWTAVWTRTTANALGRVTIALPRAAGQARVRVRFRYTGNAGGWWWAVDNVLAGTPGCIAIPGGLIEGRVNGHGGPLSAATIASTVDPSRYAISGATGLPGFYELFSPLTAASTYAASAPGYGTAAATVAVTASHITRHDWSLTQTGH